MAFEGYYAYGSLITILYAVEYVWEGTVDRLRKLGERVWVRQVIGCGENSNECMCSIEGRELNE